MSRIKYLLIGLLLGPALVHAQTAGINLLWEADTSVPAWYEGKALPSANSVITVTALPYGVGRNGLPLGPNDFSYTWQKDGLNLPDSSGVGKNSLSFRTGNVGDSNTIDLVAASPTNQLSFRERLNLRTSAPKLNLYEYDPLWGTLHEKILPPVYELTKNELSVASVPFFFNGTDARAGRLGYTWRLNGQVIANDPANPGLATFIKPAGLTSGSNQIAASIQNAANNLEQVASQITINFSR